MPKKFASKVQSGHWDELREYTVIDSSRMHDEVYRRSLIEALWRDYNMEIRAYCLARLHEGLAEEVTQEVLIKVITKLIIVIGFVIVITLFHVVISDITVTVTILQGSS